jgi:uncharacterized membrane protein
MRRAALKLFLRTALAIAVVWLVYLLKGNVWLRLYPAAVAGAFLAAFALSLRSVPLAERFARRMGEDLDDAGVAYCRSATVAWTVFLSVHFAVTVATLFASRRTWAFYNGFVAYILIGAMFLGEYAVRKRVRRG